MSYHQQQYSEAWAYLHYQLLPLALPSFHPLPAFHPQSQTFLSLLFPCLYLQNLLFLSNPLRYLFRSYLPDLRKIPLHCSPQRVYYFRSVYLLFFHPLYPWTMLPSLLPVQTLLFFLPENRHSLWKLFYSDFQLFFRSVPVFVSPLQLLPDPKHKNKLPE